MPQKANKEVIFKLALEKSLSEVKVHIIQVLWPIERHCSWIKEVIEGKLEGNPASQIIIPTLNPTPILSLNHPRPLFLLSISSLLYLCYYIFL